MIRWPQTTANLAAGLRLLSTVPLTGFQSHITITGRLVDHAVLVVTLARGPSPVVARKWKKSVRAV